MGIPKLFRNYFRTYSKSFPAHIPCGRKTSVLAIDFNSMIHHAAQKTFMYDKFVNDRVEGVEEISLKDLRGTFRMLLVELVEEVYEYFGPTHHLIIATDGVPPMSKMTQQRQRRYTKQLPSDSIKPLGGFDSSWITPGTAFMKDLDEYMAQWLKGVTMEDGVIAVGFQDRIIEDFKKYTEVDYSPSSVPGEGEHKIFMSLRALHRNGKMPSESNMVIFGMDADLTVISMIYPNIPIIVAKDRTNIAGTKMYDLVDVSVLVGDAHKLYDVSNHEFVLMTMFLGNDFVPTSPVFENMDVTLNMMTDAIRPLKKDGVELWNNGEVNWEGLRRYVAELARIEPEYLQKMAVKSRDYTPHSQALDSMDNKGVLDVEKFRRLWKKKITGIKEDKGAKGTINEFAGEKYFSEEFLTDWYEERERLMVEEYFNAVLWTMDYYTHDHHEVNKEWFYPFHYAPTFDSLLRYMPDNGEVPYVDRNWLNEDTLKKDADRKMMEEYLPPLIGLMCVLPPVLISTLVPSSVKRKRLRLRLYPDSIRYLQYYPRNFLIDGDGKRVAHMAVSLIPYIPHSVAIDMKKKSEIRLNKIGPTYITAPGISEKLYNARLSRHFESIRGVNIKKNYLGVPIEDETDEAVSVGRGKGRINFAEFNRGKQEEWRRHGKLVID